MYRLKRKMRLLILVAALFAVSQSQVINGDECDNADGWYRQDTSCYKFHTTEVSWTDAQADCESYVIGSDTAQLAHLGHPDAAAETSRVGTQHNSLASIAGDVQTYCGGSTSACGASPGVTYWIAGTPSGWEPTSTSTIGTCTDDPLPENCYDMTCGTNCWDSSAVLINGNGDYILQLSGSPYLGWNTFTHRWQWVQDSQTTGYICEFVLDTCAGPDDNMRLAWPSTAASTQQTLPCPDGYSGDATRQCQSNLIFQESNTATCSAIVEDGGWSNTDDGAYNATVNYDNLDDGFGWSAPVAVAGDKTMIAGVEYTKAFILDSGVADDKTYVEIRMGVESNDFEGTFEFTVDGNTYHNTRAPNSVVAGETADIFIIIATGAINGSFTVGVTGAASSGTNYGLTSVTATPVTRQGMSEACFRKMAFNESTAYPNFEKADSGFLSASDDLTFTFTVPRELYDMEIYFEGQTENIGFSGNFSDSMWSVDRATALYNGDVDSCGSETWAADIPWTSMSGVFTSVQSFDQNSTTTITNENEDYYVFIATMNITANEKLVAISDLSARQWELVRTMHWKYPFALKWLRDISVTSDLEVHVCTSAQTICTIRHVTAIISYIQTDINPIADLAGEDGIHGTVTVGIKTLVAYPYMFVHDEDPQFNPTAVDQVTNSSLADYNYSSAVSGWLPEVAYSPEDNPDNAGTDLEVVVTVDFTFEERTSCEHDTTLSVNAQSDKECEQNWALTITPQRDSCFIDGNYTVTWSARCFYDKPVCNFPANDAGTGYNNYVSSTLELKSTRMCPRLVQDVDLSGSLCSTGLAVEGADYTTGCDADPTYIQGESTHFYATISSSLAKIVKTEVTRIQFSQTYDFTGVAPELIPRYDNTYNTGASYMDLYTLAGNAETLTFTDQNGDVVSDAAELIVVEDVQDSNACQWNVDSSCVDAGFDPASGTDAGFRIKLNSLIFPAPADGNSEVHFRTVLRTTYEGFENFDLTEGVLEGTTLGGTDDAQWCQPTLDNDYGSSAALFCANHPSSANLDTLCPSICPASRRRLFSKEFENKARRNLQQSGSATPINDDVQEELFTTTVTLQSAKAQVVGHIDEDANQIDFTMSMIIDDNKLHDYNTARPTFYEEMEYQLGTVLGALTEQFTVHSIQRIDHGNQPALEIEVQIQKLDGLEDSQYLPSSIVKRLELLIQTGRLYDEDFFHLTAVYNMEYHENDETPHKVHFGEVDPVEGMPDDSVYTISLAFVCILFGLLW